MVTPVIRPHAYSGWSKRGQLKLQKIPGATPQAVGRLLTCHLQIEHYLGKLLLALSPSDFNVEKADLRFHQKVQLLSGAGSPIVEFGLIDGIRELNKIRNRMAHRLDGSLGQNDVAAMRTRLRRSFRGRKQLPQNPHAVIETFTLVAIGSLLGFLAAYDLGTNTEAREALLTKAKRIDPNTSTEAANHRLQPTARVSSSERSKERARRG